MSAVRENEEKGSKEKAKEKKGRKEEKVNPGEPEDSSSTAVITGVGDKCARCSCLSKQGAGDMILVFLLFHPRAEVATFPYPIANGLQYTGARRNRTDEVNWRVEYGFVGVVG